MAEYIEREAYRDRLVDLESWCQDMRKPGLKQALDMLNEEPAAEAVSLHDIYRVIAGHSYYHGDAILAALSCIVEGKEVNPVRPVDVAPVVHGVWIEDHDYLKCPECGVMVKWDFTFFDIGNWNYCPHCGAKMDGGDNNATD